MRKVIIPGLICILLLSFFIIISGCGGGSGTTVPIQVVVTNTPVIEPTAPSATATPYQTGNISGRVYTATGTEFADAFVVFQSLTVSEKIESSGAFTRTTVAGADGSYTFTNVPQGTGIISFWAYQYNYETNPNNPLGSVFITVTTNIDGITIQQGQIAPTPTSTPVVTNTLPPGTTPTPTKPDISDQFNITADYYIESNSGNLIVQLYQKTTSNLSVKGFEIQKTDNQSFPFSGAIPYKGTFNNPPSDWTEQANSNTIKWGGYTALSKGNIYSFNIRYSNVATMPQTLKITLIGSDAILGSLTVNIVQRVISPTTTPTPGSFIVTSSTVSGHTHNITVLYSDLNNPTSNITYTSNTTNGHSHALTLTQSQLTDINNGNTVTVTSSTSSGHNHTWTIMKNFSITSSITDSHTHNLVVNMADLSNPPSSGVTYTSSTTNGHSHNVTLTQTQLNSINTGNTVTVTSSSSNSHTHNWSIISPNPAPTPTPPINVIVQ